ncbi:uncharacterized protein LOC103311936 [Acyrthosiphon pisum]|uniref:HAT C-terminal dimerisation domain-containing protein n=1 Tax=Acyrthosiphon pisum TaxID=7029 RepID=A0A8R2FDD4_ACYPI|nr:uncharacterized protein LOC103311936 [Acyrthosiphon pisum]|eukprot:XP_008189999.1 PREDICTED: uncharacterized protein LOC103311936 [Acyrthosiphon pisum]
MKLSCIPILPQIYENKRKQVLENREIINALIAITLFLSQHSLPFRGHRESWDERNKGNFKDLTILISKFSPELAAYINHLKTKGKSEESSLTTGRQLFSIFQDICLENELDWRSLLVGQSYDGASNMRGQYEGLQAFIKEVNPSAVYTWCYAHRLNLVVVQVASSSANAVNMFGNVEELYNFISSSKKRIAYYENIQKENRPSERVRRLKRVNTTRWMSYFKVLQTVLFTFDIIIDTLENIKVTEPSDYKICSKANGLIEFLLTEQFIMTAICFSKIFQLLDPVTKILQSPDIDLLGAVNNPKQEFKVNTYFMIIDAAISSIETRFHSTDLRAEYIQYSRSFFEFEDAVGFQQTYIHGKKYTSNNDSEHESEESPDSDWNEDEGGMYVHKHNNLGTLLHMLQVCHKAGLKNVFPCLYDALHIACTLPVASTTPERTFSKLKIVKNRLRTTISQDRLEQLLIMSCESDIEIDNGQVIDIFANCSSV